MQRATPSWISEAADRAERRIGGEMPGHATPLKQLQTLIDAIRNPRMKRDDLVKLARSLAGEGA
jgi:hypothetical protein